MRILRVINTLNPATGGPVAGILQITPYLSELGVSTTVLSLDKPDSPWLIQSGFQSIGCGPSLTGYGYVKALPSRILQYARHHDHVIVHGLWQSHSLAVLRALRGTSIPYSVYPHGMLDPWFQKTYPLKHIKKSLYWLLAESRVLHNASAVLFTTECERELASHSFSPYRVNDIVLGYGASPPPADHVHQRQAFLTTFPTLQNKRIILYLGRIHPKKGIDLLLYAFASICHTDSTLHLVIAGPDSTGHRSALQLLCISLGISERVIWTGMLLDTLKWGALRSAELFCLPSHQENFGIAVAEALSCAIPVMIANTVNISGEVANACAGIIHSDTRQSTIDALAIWINMPATEKSTMSLNAELLFKARFDLSSVARNLLSYLQSS